MNDILSELSKPSWWMTVVIAGLIINLASAYLKRPIDKGMSIFSKTWRESLQQAMIKREKDLENLQDNQALISAKLDMIYFLLGMGIIIIIVLVLIFSVGEIINTFYNILSIIGLDKFILPETSTQLIIIAMQASFAFVTIIFLPIKIVKALYLEDLLREHEKRKGNKIHPYGLL